MIMDRIALILAIVGGLNWGSIGLFRFDIVAWLFGGQTATVSRVVYTLVVLLLAQVGQNAGLSAAALESLKSIVQRLVLLDIYFRHLFPSLQKCHAAPQGPMNWLFNVTIIPA